MILKDDAFYPINDIFYFVGWSKRKLQRYASNNNLRKIDGRYLFTGLDVKKIKDISDNVATTSIKDSKKNVQLDLEVESIKAEDLDGYITETFTEEEHDQLQKLIYNEPLKRDKLQDLVDTIKDYKLQIEYLRKSLDNKDEQMNLLIHSVKESLETIKETQKNMQQRNYIEALKEQEKKK